MFSVTRLIKISAVALLLGTSVLAMPAHAADAATATSKGKHTPREWNMRDHVEGRIRALHDAIDVTADQEADWNNVAQTMRENESDIGDLIKKRHESNETRSAIDDLKSFQAISQAHADHIGKFLDAFEPFYNNLSPDQKQKADDFFRNFGRKFGPHHGKPGMKVEKGVEKTPAPIVKPAK